MRFQYVFLLIAYNFYYCYGRDSYIISYLLNYKINILKDYTYSCSFPQNAVNKVISVLENKQINYIILDRRNNYEIIEKSDNRNLNKYDKIYEIGRKEKAKKMRVEKIYSYLLENSNDTEFIDKIEKVINERRKI